MKVKIQLKMLVFLSFLLFQNMKLKVKKLMKNLQRLCTANIKNEIGKCTYTPHMLNEGWWY